jgi:hypothetical protein
MFPYCYLLNKGLKSFILFYGWLWSNKYENQRQDRKFRQIIKFWAGFCRN